MWRAANTHTHTHTHTGREREGESENPDQDFSEVDSQEGLAPEMRVDRLHLSASLRCIDGKKQNTSRHFPSLRVTAADFGLSRSPNDVTAHVNDNIRLINRQQCSNND